MPSINHSYLNLCSAKIQFSALCRVRYWLYGFIYTSESIHYLFVLTNPILMPFFLKEKAGNILLKEGRFPLLKWVIILLLFFSTLPNTGLNFK